MAKTTDDFKKRSGAELRALAEQRRQADPAQEAAHHEALFLKGIGSAQQEFDWLIAHAAWTLLGFESVVGWWDSRVRPVMVQLEMRPTAEMVDKILAAVREVERALPAAQRRTQRELASLVLASDWKVRGRTDSRNRRTAAGSDLDNPTVDAEENQKKTAAAGGNPAADEASSQSAQTSVDDASAGTGDVVTVAGPGKPPTADEPLVSSDGEPATPSTTPPPAAGAGAPPEADRPVPAVNPTDHPASAVPGAPPVPDEGSGTGDETDPGMSPQEPGDVDGEQEREGVSAPAPAPPPSWLVAITNVIHAVDELDKEEPAEVAPLIAADLADELGQAFDQLHAWYLHLRDRTP